MHSTQGKLLKLAAEYNLGRMSYREIGKLIGESHPQKVKYHLKQLEKNKIIKSDADGTSLKKTSVDKNIISIPILGSANCGPASIFADENIEGYLRVSTKLLPRKKELFALKAVGNSMNRAIINGKGLEDGDFAIIDSKEVNPRNNDYVVSVIDGVCNIKKFIQDNLNNQIVLISESVQEYPPIYIHPDETSYFVSGKVIDIIKKPSIRI